jgi:hypothetical protein
MSGWIKLHRSIVSHWLYTEKRTFSRFEAWNDILLTVNFTDAQCCIKGKVYLVKRGESILSFDSWAKRWNWEKSKVRRFFLLLKSDNMIELKTDNITTHLIVCNYDTYQDIGNANETQTKRKRNANEIQTQPIEEGKKERKKEYNNIEFDVFWNLYDKKVGDKEKIKAKWENLNIETQNQILEFIPKYKLAKPDKLFRKDPSTFFNNKSWNDEIIETVKTNEPFKVIFPR